MSGAPDLMLSVWELKGSRMLCSVKLPFVAAASSFNPRSAANLCVHSASSLQLWTVKQSYQHHSLEAVDVQPGDEVGTGGLWGCHAWGTADEIFAGTDTGAVVLKEPAQHEPALAFAGGSAVAGLLADSMHVLVACRDGSLTWYARTGFTPLFELRTASPISSMAVSADFFKLLISTTDGGVEQERATSRHHHHHLHCHPHRTNTSTTSSLHLLSPTHPRPPYPPQPHSLAGRPSALTHLSVPAGGATPF